MNENQNENMRSEEYQELNTQPEENAQVGVQPEEISDTEVVFDESYEAEEVESTVLPVEEDFEDELDRIPLEKEPTMQEVLMEVQQSKKQQVNNQKTSNGVGNSNKKIEKNEYGLGVTAMILGILSILLFCVPVLGLVLAAVAVVLGIVAAARNNGKKMGSSGIIMGTISLLSYLTIFLLFGGIFRTVNENQDYFTDTAWRRTTDGSVLYLYSDGTFIDVEREGSFTDNFYTGTYDVLSYEDAGIDFSGIEGQYDTEYAYDVYLYVDTYVSNGEERENIANTIRYLYLFDKNYTTGEVVEICAHDSTQYGAIYPAKETDMAYPSSGNQYLRTEEISEEISDTEMDIMTEDVIITEEVLHTDVVVTETTTTEKTTIEEPATEQLTTEKPVTEESDTEELSTEDSDIDASSTTEDYPLWGDIEDFIDDSKEEFEEFSSSASEEWENNSEEISSAIEQASSAVDEASSAFEEASSAVEEFEENLDTNKIQQFFERIVKAIQDWLVKWGF